jgi:hypothetical protein
MTILLQVCRLIFGDGEVENCRPIDHNRGEHYGKRAHQRGQVFNTASDRAGPAKLCAPQSLWEAASHKLYLWKGFCFLYVEDVTSVYPYTSGRVTVQSGSEAR